MKNHDRDLKPENLLLDANKNIKIVDFSLSNIYQPGDLLKTACGSPCYAAPEMIAGKNYVPLKVDVWSAGITLFALVCGYLPFEDPSTAELYKKILIGDFEIPKFVSPAASDLIKKMLNVDPETRVNFEDIFEHPWFQQLPLDPELLDESKAVSVIIFFIQNRVYLYRWFRLTHLSWSR